MHLNCSYQYAPIQDSDARSLTDCETKRGTQNAHAQQLLAALHQRRTIVAQGKSQCTGFCSIFEILYRKLVIQIDVIFIIFLCLFSRKVKMDSHHHPELISINDTVVYPRNNATLHKVYDGGLVYLCEPGTDFDSINAAFFWLIFIVSVTGNGLLLHILFHFENLRNVTNLFVLNLTCSDLVFTITLPFWAIYHTSHWVFGDLACKFLTAAYFVGLYSSVILLTAITVDRFITVVVQNQLSTSVRRHRCAMGACAGAWIISIAASLSEAVDTVVEEVRDGFFTCGASSSYSDSKLGYYLQVSLLFFLPFAIIVFCYSAILRTVMHTSNRRKLRTVMVVLSIVLVFFVCWGPYHIMLLVHTLYQPRGCIAEESFYLANDICRLLAYSHCCMNPLLYMFSQKLRRHLVRLFRCETVRRRNSDRGSRQGSSNVFQNGVVTSNLLELQSK